MHKSIVVNFVGLRGGGVSYAYQMVRGLLNNACNVHAIVSSEMENIAKWRGISNLHLIEIKGYSTFLNMIPRLIMFLIKEKRLIHDALKGLQVDAVYLPATSYWAWLVNRQLRKYRLIYTMHDPIPHNRWNLLANYGSHRCAKDADAIIVLSEHFRDYVKQKYNLSDDRIVVIPLGNQSYYESASKANCSPELRGPKHRFLFYGRIAPYKGINVLAEAYQRLKAEFEDISLTVAGSGRFDAYKESFRNVKDFTLINRWIDESEVASLFSCPKTITVVPYLSGTQSGVIPIAMQFRSLVIATRVGGLLEQVRHQETGLLVEPNDGEQLYDAMKYAITHEEETRRLVDNAYDYIQSLSWDRLSEKIVGLVESLAQEVSGS